METPKESAPIVEKEGQLAQEDLPDQVDTTDQSKDSAENLETPNESMQNIASADQILTQQTPLSEMLTSLKDYPDVKKTGDKIYKSSETNIKRGKITDKISPSGNLIKNPSGDIAGAMETEKISSAVNNVVSNETTVLESAPDTTVLNDVNETTVLNLNQGETTVLEQPSIFAIEYEITFVHTSEVIAV